MVLFFRRPRRLAALLTAGLVGLAPLAAATKSAAAPKPAAAALSATPARQALKVELALMADPLTFRCPLRARPVEGGVELEGLVPSASVKAHALALAAREAGTAVRDEIRVGGVSPEGFKPAAPEALVRDVNRGLREVLGTRADPIEIGARGDGQVTLRGSVASAEEKHAVSARMRLVSGCACVVNHLEIEGSEATASTDGEMPPAPEDPPRPAPSPEPAPPPAPKDPPADPPVMPPALKKKPAKVLRVADSSPYASVKGSAAAPAVVSAGPNSPYKTAEGAAPALSSGPSPYAVEPDEPEDEHEITVVTTIDRPREEADVDAETAAPERVPPKKIMARMPRPAEVIIVPKPPPSYIPSPSWKRGTFPVEAPVVTKVDPPTEKPLPSWSLRIAPVVPPQQQAKEPPPRQAKEPPQRPRKSFLSRMRTPPVSDHLPVYPDESFLPAHLSARTEPMREPEAVATVPKLESVPDSAEKPVAKPGASEPGDAVAASHEVVADAVEPADEDGVIEQPRQDRPAYMLREVPPVVSRWSFPSRVLSSLRPRRRTVTEVTPLGPGVPDHPYVTTGVVLFHAPPQQQ